MTKNISFNKNKQEKGVKDKKAKKVSAPVQEINKSKSKPKGAVVPKVEADKAKASATEIIKKNQPMSVEPVKKEGRKIKYNLLRGMHDVLPRDEKYWEALYNQAVNLAKHFRFKKIQTPILEESALFIRSIGKGTDVVDKEMYVFEDNDGHKVCLRPEMTASVVRAYVAHGLWNAPQPLKLWYWGPMYRHDRPQAGRYREFYQFGCESFGDDDPVLDAELILLAYKFYNDLGLPVEIHINSIGTLEERERYKIALVEYYRSKRSYLCEDCRKRINKNPLRLLDCKHDQCQPVKDEAPQILEWLESDSKNHLMNVLEYLDELDIPYQLTHTLVRGLDYYTKTVFEVFPRIEGEEEKAQSALGGGGRYDLLTEQMGGKPTPAGGFSVGVERSISFMKKCCEQGICSVSKPSFDIFFAQLGEQARKRSLKIINDLMDCGIKLDFNLSKKSLKGQLDIANSLKVSYALILGQKEVQDSTIIIRDMESGVQEIIDQNKIKKVLFKKLGINGTA
ncbi:MAG: histidine--tRNA ligase [bacterium]